MSWLQQDKHRIKISSVEFIKIPSAAKKLQLFTMEWDSSPENCKTTLKKKKGFSNLATAVLDNV